MPQVVRQFLGVWIRVVCPTVCVCVYTLDNCDIVYFGIFPYLLMFVDCVCIYN